MGEVLASYSVVPPWSSSDRIHPLPSFSSSASRNSASGRVMITAEESRGTFSPISLLKPCASRAGFLLTQG